ncbi:MAG: VWA domain-containing protein, partial [Planctomycetaceae bacterium]
MSVNFVNVLFAAVEQSRGYSVLELDVPSSLVGRLAMFGGFALMIAFVIYMYVRDTVNMALGWRIWLASLRVAVILALAAIALNPSRRTPEMMYRPSQVAILVDTSLSMNYPELNQSSETTGEVLRSRSDAVEQLLQSSTLIEQLNRQHQVSVFTFDSRFEGPVVVYPYGQGAQVADQKAADPPTSDVQNVDWSEILRPRGVETRLGDSLRALIGKVRSRSLSGIVVVSDGASNAGFSPDSAHDVAQSAGLRLITVGIGSTEKQVNLQLVNLQAPTDVHVGDAYDIKVLVQGQGFAGRRAVVELLSRDEVEADAEPTLLETKEATLLEDGVPVEVVFRQMPTVAGSMEFFVRTRPVVKVKEWSAADNERRKAINLSDKKTRVLLMAGGPMRDYRFLRNMLYRHPGINVDVWLQTVDAGSQLSVSQESDQLLVEFPPTPADMSRYDVVVAFDPDWSAIPAERLPILIDWVEKHAGGIILVAGDVHTPALASDSGDLKVIQELFPVFLNEFLLTSLDLESESRQPWPIQFSREGLDAGFLQLIDDPEASGTVWSEFEGFYRAYPTAGAKAGATVFAEFADPQAQTENGQPILIASHFFGSGRALFLGSAEFWRLRASAEEYYDRFWTKAIREVGQGRRQRGTDRGLMMLERKEFVLGQTIRIRARLFDQQLKELQLDSVAVRIVAPNGRELVPARIMTKDANRPGQYVGDFRASELGTYRIEIAIPDDSGDVNPENPATTLTEKIDVLLPNLEADHPEQNAKLLTNLVRDTGGRYLTLDQVEEELPGLLTNKGEEFVINEWPEILWDRNWVLYLIVGLLSAE